MKNLIIATLLVVGIAAFAQDKKEMKNRPDRRPAMEKMSTEQQNQLMLKKMTLELDLNSKQQEQFKKIIANKSVRREAMKTERMEKKADQKKPTADERFEMKNKMFDEQIAMKDKMKSILSAEQFEKWNEMKEKHQEKFQRRNHEGMPNHKKNN